MNVLTQARNALWDSIDNYEPLRDRFRTKISYDRAERPGCVNRPYRQSPTSRNECNAIALVGSDCETGWRLNKTLEIPYTIGVLIWSQENYLSDIEDLYFDVIRAVHQAKAPDDNLTYLERSVSKKISAIERAVISLETVEPLDNQPNAKPIKLLKLTGGITVTPNFNPFTA